MFIECAIENQNKKIENQNNNANFEWKKLWFSKKFIPAYMCHHGIKFKLKSNKQLVSSQNLKQKRNKFFDKKYTN